MITEHQIEQFYKDVDSLKLKFPVAAIAKATGFGKSTVSVYLTKTKEPSESFIEKFYESFTIVPRGGESGPKNYEANEERVMSQANEDSAPYNSGTRKILIDTNVLIKLITDSIADKLNVANEKVLAEKELRRQDFEAALKKANEEKDQLFNLVKSDLSRIKQDQSLALAYQKAWVELHAEEVSGGDQTKAKAVKAKMGRLVGEKSLGPLPKDTPSVQGK